MDPNQQTEVKQTEALPQQNPTLQNFNSTPRHSNNWIKLLIIFLVLVIIGTSGYYFGIRKNQPISKPHPIITPSPSQLSPTPTHMIYSDITSEQEQQVVGAHNIFGFSLFQELEKEDKNQNIFISPLSASLALSMLYNGADGQTKDAMANALQVKGIDILRLNKSNTNIASLLANPDNGITLSIANSLWIKNGTQIIPNFLTINKNYYLASVTNLDFSNPQSADKINKWASDNTNGKIPTVVNPPIPSNEILMLLNAVYFKGTWTEQFEKNATKEDTFTNIDGVTTHAMMTHHAKYQYVETNDFQGIALPYGKSQRMNMYVFLPKVSLSQFLQQLNPESWATWTNNFRLTDGTIILPKFKLNYNKQLNNALKALGMGNAFANSANFDLLSSQSVAVSDVTQGTYVDVNEEGTEAAAVTAIGVGMGSIGENSFVMNVNKPFFFAIVDNKTHEILFMGTIEKL